MFKKLAAILYAREMQINSLSAQIIDTHMKGLSEDQGKRILEEAAEGNQLVRIQVALIKHQKQNGPRSTNYPLKPDDTADDLEILTVAIGQQILQLMGIPAQPIPTDRERTLQQLKEIADNLKWSHIDRPSLVAALAVTHSIKNNWRIFEDPRAKLCYLTEAEIRAADEQYVQIARKNPAPG